MNPVPGIEFLRDRFKAGCHSTTHIARGFRPL
jgi:hypothetical protein